MKYECVYCKTILIIKKSLNDEDGIFTKPKKEDSYSCPICSDVMTYKKNNKK